MYQHDVSEQKLAKTLDAIVTECVSFVGEFSHIFLCLCRDGATSNIVTGGKWGTIFYISGSFGKIIHLGNLKCAEA